VLNSPLVKNVREQLANNVIKNDKAILRPLQVGYKKCGQSGAEVEKDKKCAGEIQALWRAISRKLAGLGK